MGNPIANRRMKDRKRRKKLREKLTAQGVPEELIEQIIEQRRHADRAARHGYKGTDVYQYDPDNDAGYYPNDSGYEPSEGDPLLRGVARATGMTARVVRRRDTITRWQYERAINPGDTE
jgi:hypothetical protein